MPHSTQPAKMTDVVTKFKATGQWPNATSEHRRLYKNVGWVINGERGPPPSSDAANVSQVPTISVDPSLNASSEQISFLSRLSSLDSLASNPNATNAAASCYIKHWDAIETLRTSNTSDMCFPYFDDFTCWPAVDSGKSVILPCSSKFKPPVFVSILDRTIWHENLTVTRSCSQTGDWVGQATTDYSPCVKWILKVSTGVDISDTPTTVMRCPNEGDNLSGFAQAVAYPYMIGILLCLACEILALIIFIFFRRQQDCRIKIHIHLLMSFIIRFAIILCTVLQVAYRSNIPMSHTRWLCRVFHISLRFAILSNVFWMFVEGFYLHNRIAVCVFRNEANMKLFYFMGWGAPMAFVAGYALYVILNKIHDFCPNPLRSLGLEHFIYGLPMILVYTINTGFLVNIFRVLVTRLRSTVTLEISQMRRALQASFILFVLLGSTNIMFVWTPFAACSVADRVWRLITCALELLQGILVPIFYCFTCKDIQQAVRNRWYRYRLNRINGRSLFSMRRTPRSSHNTAFTTRTAPGDRPIRLRFLRADAVPVTSGIERGALDAARSQTQPLRQNSKSKDETVIRM